MTNDYKTTCSICNKELLYSSKHNLKRALSLGSMCLSCSKKGSRHHLYGKESPKKGKYSQPVLDAISSGLVWHDLNNIWYRKCSNCKKDVKASTPNKALKRINCLCYSCISKNRIYSSECRNKMKQSAILRIKTQGGVSNFNKDACVFIENYGTKNGYNFQHALNGGEVWIDGFCLDGYDYKNSIAFEYDEPQHEKKKNKFLDLGRTKKLLKNEKIKEIIRYSKKYNKLYKSYPTYSIPL